MLIILNEDDCIAKDGTVTVNINDCRRTVKSDGQVIYETGDVGWQRNVQDYYVDADGILVRRD